MSPVIAVLFAVVALIVTAVNQAWSVRTSARLSALASVTVSLVDMWNRTNRAAVAWNTGTAVALASTPSSGLVVTRPAVRYQQPPDDDDDFPPPSYNLRDAPRKSWYDQ